MRLTGITLAALLTPAALAHDPLSGDYTRETPTDVRIATYNVQGEFIANSSKDAAFERILQVIDADVFVFTEIPNITESELAARMDDILPLDFGECWEVHFGIDTGIRTAIASRHPLLMERVDTIPASSTRGVTMALVDLPDETYATDIYLMGVHLKAFSDEDSQIKRRRSADAIANWLGDARGVARPSGDNVVLPDNTPIVVLGDFNLVGGPLPPPWPEEIIRTGSIFDEDTFGPEVAGDWDASDMADLTPRDPFTLDPDTWRSDTTSPSSRLDRFFYTDSVMIIANSFVLNTLTMSSSALANAGLNVLDTTPNESADHLPIAMDIAIVPVIDYPTGDVNQDCIVDLADLLEVIGNWGTDGTAGGDVNDDGSVNLTDLLLLIAHWGEVC